MRVILTAAAVFCAVLSIASTLCTEQQQAVFVASNSNLTACAPQLQILNTSTDPAVLDEALDTVCTARCGGVLYEYLRTTCQDTLSASSLAISCQKRSDFISPFTRCHSAIISASPVLTAIAALSCLSQVIPDQATCVSFGCQASLMNITTLLGCCYQSTYNSSTYLQLLRAQGSIDEAGVNSTLAIGNPNLWTTCGVTPPSTCINTGNEFPVVCTEQDITAFFISNPRILACAQQLQALNSNDTRVVDEALDTVCTAECGGTYTAWLRNTCQNEFQASSIAIACLKRSDPNRPFTRCQNAFTNSEQVFSSTAVTCLGNTISDQATCVSTGCQASLMNIVTQIGCCYQSSYNSSTYLQLLRAQGFLTEDLINGIPAHGNPVLWMTCGVTPPSACANTGNPFPILTTEAVTTAHSTRVAPQFTVTALAMVFIGLKVLFK